LVSGYAHVFVVLSVSLSLS